MSHTKKSLSFSYTITQDTHWQNQASWQSSDTPFMSFEFWQALRQSGAIGQQTGWQEMYIVVQRQFDDVNVVNGSRTSSDYHINHTNGFGFDEGNLEDLEDLDCDCMEESDDGFGRGCENSHAQIVAVLPVFIKTHHLGEFVFDHAWAEAYAHYGLDYYPRLVSSVPYTPITGQRLWLAEGVGLTSELLATALAGVDEVAKQHQASSWHGLFVSAELVDKAKQTLSALPLLERQGCQFLWQNCYFSQNKRRFADFEEFLLTLTAKKRKNIRQERQKVAKQGIHCRIKLGEQISAEDWNVFYQCYVMTYVLHGQKPYLDLAFFRLLGQTLPQRLMLAQAVDEQGKVVASSLFLYDEPNSPNATLYGRYWGALAEYDSLHFELCYYQGIEFAIAQGLQYFDPGTQGEHKLIRGFVPTKTYSLHRIYDKRFTPAIDEFCEQDRHYMALYRQKAYQALPFNSHNFPDFQG